LEAHISCIHTTTFLIIVHKEEYIGLLFVLADGELKVEQSHHAVIFDAALTRIPPNYKHEY
jgi:hypothetical protein